MDVLQVWDACTQCQRLAWANLWPWSLHEWSVSHIVIDVSVNQSQILVLRKRSASRRPVKLHLWSHRSISVWQACQRRHPVLGTEHLAGLAMKLREWIGRCSSLPLWPLVVYAVTTVKVFERNINRFLSWWPGLSMSLSALCFMHKRKPMKNIRTTMNPRVHHRWCLQPRPMMFLLKSLFESHWLFLHTHKTLTHCQCLL